MLHAITQLTTNHDGVTDRHAFLRATSGVAALGLLNWRVEVGLRAEDLRKRGLACILLWMGGGPSQFETFDLKPGVPTGGPTKVIDTAVPGIRIAENWERVAEQMKDIALIRSMTAKEGEHQRATYHVHIGYTPSPAVKYPSIGSVVASEIAPNDFDLPPFVRIGGSAELAIGPSYLGMHFAPFQAADPLHLPANVELPRAVGTERLDRRLDLMKDLSEEFEASGRSPSCGSTASDTTAPRGW